MKPAVKFFIFFLASLLLNISVSRHAETSEIDILLKKLVEKGVLTRAEGEAILEETREEAKKEQAKTIARTKQALLNGDSGFKLAALPPWVQKMTLTGDFRLRYEYTSREKRSDRNRGRYRLRLGVITEITDTFTLGFGLATGDSNPRSTNQTMTGSFESPDFRLDYAYLRYAPAAWLTFTGGKFKNPLWRVGDLLWDSDVRPEGVSMEMEGRMSDTLGLFLTAGFWIIDEESGDGNDPVMFVLQPGMKLSLSDRTFFKTAVSYYGFSNVDGADLDHSMNTNTRELGVLKHDYDALVFTGELGMVHPFDTALPYLAFFAEYVNNVEVSNEDDGYMLGVKFGEKKVRTKGQWQFKYNYRRLETDAWLDVWPDSDAYGGTDARGHEFIFIYGLCRDINFALDYYRMENIQGRHRSEDLLQVDLNVNF